MSKNIFAALRRVWRGGETNLADDGANFQKRPVHRVKRHVKQPLQTIQACFEIKYFAFLAETQETSK